MSNKRKSRAVREPVPDIGGLTADSLLTTKQVVPRVAGLLHLGDKRARRDRVRKQLAAHPPKEHSPGVFTAGVVGDWARAQQKRAPKKWAGEFDKLPTTRPNVADGAFDLPLLQVAGGGPEQPSDLAACHATIAAMTMRIMVLEGKLAAAYKLVRDLAPEAEWALRQKAHLRGARNSKTKDLKTK